MSNHTIIISPIIGVVIFFLATFVYAQQENSMKYPQVNMNLNFSITDNDYRVNDKQPISRKYNFLYFAGITGV